MDIDSPESLPPELGGKGVACSVFWADHCSVPGDRQWVLDDDLDPAILLSARRRLIAGNGSLLTEAAG